MAGSGLNVLQAVAGVAGLLAVAVRGAERRLVRRLQRAGAVDPSRAVALDSRRPLTDWQRRRLTNGGAIVEASRGRFYFSEEGYRAFRARRRDRAVRIILAIAALALVGLWLRRWI